MTFATRSSGHPHATRRCMSPRAPSPRRFCAELGIVVDGRPVEVGGETTEEGMREATDAARTDRDTLGGVAEVVATGVPPGLGSYAEKADRLDARIAAALMGIQAVKGVEIGDGFALARRRGTEAHDEIDPGLVAPDEPSRRDRGGHVERRADRRASGDEAAADADAATRLCRSRDRRARTGARRALRRAGRRGARGCRRGGGGLRAGPCRTREVRRRRARRRHRCAGRVPRPDRRSMASR